MVVSQRFFNEVMSRKSTLRHLFPSTSTPLPAELLMDRSTTEMYQAFMTGYVKRINEATLNVTIGGIRIGSAKYSRLAQINLKSRIITFSRYAIDNVPERGRRYLVIHELAHVKEPSHNRHFWDIVEHFEPNYKQIGKSLELAFKRNVKEEQLNQSKVQMPNPLSGRMEAPKLLLGTRLLNFSPTVANEKQTNFDPQLMEDEDINDESFDCMEDEFSDCGNPAVGTIHGGVELPLAQLA